LDKKKEGIMKNIKEVTKTEKYEIQVLIEKILLNHEIEPEEFAYFLILSRPGISDLLIRKNGNRFEIGYNYYFLTTDGETLHDIVISFAYNQGLWIQTKIEKSNSESTQRDEEWFEEMRKTLGIQEWLEKGVLNCSSQLESKFCNVLYEHKPR
jgi:hypothetical protein